MEIILTGDTPDTDPGGIPQQSPNQSLLKQLLEIVLTRKGRGDSSTFAARLKKNSLLIFGRCSIRTGSIQASSPCPSCRHDETPRRGPVLMRDVTQPSAPFNTASIVLPYTSHCIFSGSTRISHKNFVSPKR
jgi:hypothetical protein